MVSRIFRSAWCPWWLCAVSSLLALGLSGTDVPCLIYRLSRNAALHRVPAPLPPVYPPCGVDELVETITIIATVKDTCTQAVSFLAHLASVVPRDMHILYVTPRFVGCDRVDIEGRSVLPRLQVLRIGEDASPIAGFLAAQPLVRTRYALLLHNDAYAMNNWSLCELARALDAHPEAAFAAPQLYERAENGIVVPHGHHRNLHLRRVAGRTTVAYDIDFDLLTRRRVSDFEGTEGPQLDFMEDHAYLGRTDSYHLYMDPRASFTMEYIDNVLSMRARQTYPWYVPTASFVFDVNVNKLGWRDLPYFAWKRSDRLGLEVRSYLTQKWGGEFPNTGIWSYVRYSMLQGLALEDNELPSDWQGQAALVLAWFESVGFDSYDGQPLSTRLAHLPARNSSPNVKIQLGRMSAIQLEAHLQERTRLSADERCGRHWPCVADLLPLRAGEKRINVTMEDARLPISISVTDQCDPTACGLLLLDAGRCVCFTNRMALPESSPSVRLLEWMADVTKLPSRILRYVELKKWVRGFDARAETSGVWCAADAACEYTLRLGGTIRLVRWSWMGNAS